MRAFWLTILTLSTACVGQPISPPATDNEGVVPFEGEFDPESLSNGDSCDPGSAPVACYVDPEVRGSALICGLGTRYCRDGEWSACEHVSVYELDGMASLIEEPVECNPCNPDCSTARTRPDDDDLTDENSDGVEYDPGAGGVVLPPSTHGTTGGVDSDRDGIPDAADDCPRAAGVEEFFGCPPEAGAAPGLYHALPFGGPVEIDPCELNVQIRSVDVYMLMDTTGSMGGEIANLQAGLTSGTLIPGCDGGVIGAIGCEIPDAWFGVGRFDDFPVPTYGGTSDVVYRNFMNMADNPAAANTAVRSLDRHWGYDWPESHTPALWAIATGRGIGSYLANAPACPGGRNGYPCFRPDAIPVIVMFTDAPFHNGTIGGYNYAGDVGTIAPTWTQMISAVQGRGIKVLSIESSGRHPYTMQDLTALANATDSLNAAGAPFIFSIPWDGTGLSSAVVNAVRELADYSRSDVSAIAVDNPATAFDERQFVESIVARSWGPRGSCTGLAGNEFFGCLPGTDTNFEIGFRNDVVMGSATTQVFNFEIQVLINGSSIIARKPVRIVVPPTFPACATVELEGRRIIPNVMTLVDQSGSMGWSFTGAPNRWIAVRDALVGSTGTGADRGLIGELERQVRFGLMTYTSYFQGSGCSNPVRGVDSIALNNYSAINTFYRSQNPGGGTPTFEALRELYNRMIATPPVDGPQIMILATDGAPNGCNSATAQANVEAEVARAYLAGIRTFVISVGTGVSSSHLQRIANNGVGMVGAPFWVATDSGGLQTAMENIIRGEINCEIDLDTNIEPDIACLGEVFLNGERIPCDDPNGFRLLDENTIELQGAACMTLQNDPDATLNGQFPCPPVTGTFSRVYDAESRCEIPPTRPRWGSFTWDVETPPGTSIIFSFRTAADVPGIDAARAVDVVIPDDAPTMPLDVGALLESNGLPADLPILHTQATLQGSIDRLRTPVFTEMQQDWTCLPGE